MERKIRAYIRTWQQRCYPELPDEAPAEISDRVPSYKRIALAILKNDYNLQTLGFSPPKSEVYNSLKRKELNERAMNMYSDILKMLSDNPVLFGQKLTVKLTPHTPPSEIISVKKEGQTVYMLLKKSDDWQPVPLNEKTLVNSIYQRIRIMKTESLNPSIFGDGLE